MKWRMIDWTRYQTFVSFVCESKYDGGKRLLGIIHRFLSVEFKNVLDIKKMNMYA